MFYSERLKRWELTLEMYWLQNFIEIILFEEFREHETMWQKIVDASSRGLRKLREYRFLQNGVWENASRLPQEWKGSYDSIPRPR